MSINHPKWTGLSSLPNGKMLICPTEFVTGREAEGPAQSSGSSVTSASERGRKKGNSHFHIQGCHCVPSLKITRSWEEPSSIFSKVPALIMALDTFQQSEVHHPQRRAWGAVPGPVFRKPTRSFSLAHTARTGKISDFSWTKETLTISNLSSVSFYRNKTCAVMIQKCSSRDCQGCFTPASPS